MQTIILFFIAQIVNVILSTLKSVITIKGGKLHASIISAITYSFNIIVMKSLTSVNMLTAILIVIITNLIGVYLGLVIVDKMGKQQVWRITTTVPTDSLKDFKKALNDQEIAFVAYETSWDDFKVVDIFSKHKTDSKQVKNIFKEFDVKYTISANAGAL